MDYLTEVDYQEMVDLTKMDRQEQDEIRGRLNYKKIVDICKQSKRDGHEWAWVDTSASTSEVVQSYQRPSIRCFSDMQTPRHVMRTSMVSMTPSFPLRKTTKSIASRMDGQSGFRVGGHCRR